MNWDDRDTQYLLGELNGKVDRILCELQKINGRLNRHEDQIEEHDRVIEQHKSYFRIIGGAIGVIITLIAAAIAVITSKL